MYPFSPTLLALSRQNILRLPSLSKKRAGSMTPNLRRGNSSGPTFFQCNPLSSVISIQQASALNESSGSPTAKEDGQTRISSEIRIGLFLVGPTIPAGKISSCDQVTPPS